VRNQTIYSLGDSYVNIVLSVIINNYNYFSMAVI